LATNDLQEEISKEIDKQITEQLEKDIVMWAKESKSDIEIAVEIYAPLERKQASKAVVAQIFSRILTDSKIDVAEILKDPHLKYLVDAIKYVTNV